MRKVCVSALTGAVGLFFVFSCQNGNDDSPTPDCRTPPTATVAPTNTGCGTPTGSLVVTATGSGTLQFSLDGTTFQAASTFAGLAAGDYTVTVKDANGCTSTVNFRIGVAEDAVSFANTIQPIISTNCALSGCHVAGTGRPNFTEFATIQARASAIKTRTGDRSMPLGRTLTDEQIQQIACWVDAGAPNN